MKPDRSLATSQDRLLALYKKMGITLTPVRSTDILAAWKMVSRVLALITLERSKKWTSGFAVRKVAAAIRLKRVKDVSGESLLAFIREAVALGTTIHTDGWKGYIGLPAAGYKHRVTVISSGEEQVHEVMPRVHNVASLLKRWLLGTLQGGVQQQHLDYYLDEFTLRFNRRRSSARGLLFHRLAQQAASVDTAPYRSIICSTSASPG